MRAKFKEGDRVVHFGYERMEWGTVIAMWIEKTVDNKAYWVLDVIFDAGHRRSVPANDFWKEEEYDPDIPF